MPNFFYLTLDTTGVANPSIIIDGGAAFSTAQLANLIIGTTEAPTTGYQMKIWGDVDNSNDANIQTTEVASAWITYNTSKQAKWSPVDGIKNIYLKIRDDVYNESEQVSSTIILDTTLPTVTKTGPDVPKVSKQEGKNIASFSFQADCIFSEYKVKVVAAIGNAHDTGIQIGTTNGSTNMSGIGSYPANTPINCTITGADVEAANSGDTDKIIKVFVKDTAGQWCV